MLLAGLAAVSCTTFPWLGWRQQSKGENWVRTTLDNGLRIVVIEDHAAPVVALNVWVRTGSADETESELGMAHVFEHMLFKGTERRAVGEIAQTIEAAGGDINAFTSFDMTVYHITMASRDASIGIDVLADAVLHSTFDPVELDREKEVVLEEIRRGKDSPSRVLSDSTFAKAYTAHPYRRSIIGTEESVQGFTRDELLEFHSKWYVPNNMTFVAVGDLDPTATLEQIRDAFREAKPRPGLEHPRDAELPRTGPRPSIVRRDFNQSQVGIAFPITEFANPDSAYLDLLALILGEGESSRLYRNVKDRQGVVHTIGAGAYTPLDPGLFLITATLDSDRIESALAAIGSEVHRLRSFGPSAAELEKARVILLSSQVHEKETMQGQSRKFGYFETLGGGIEKEQEYLDRIRRATVDNVLAVARTYLVPERLTLVALLPQEERPDLEEASLVPAYRSKESRTESKSKEVVREGIWRYRLPNGLNVIVKRNPSVPLVAFRIAFLGGQLAENEENQGISSFLAEMLERGTEQRSSAQIAAEVEGIAGALGGFSGRNSFGFVGQFLRESLDTGLDLFADMLLHPAFPEEEIEKVRTEMLAAIIRKEDHLASKAFDLFSATLYDGHPYRFPTIGTEETVSGFKREMLVDYYQSYARPQDAVLAVAGDVEPDEIVEAIAARLADWNPQEGAQLPTRTPPPPPDSWRQRELEKNRNQSHVVVGFRGLSVDDPDRPALEVLTQVLSGQGGRLFMELRDRQSLAYSVSAFSIEGVDPGAFGVYIACAPEKVDDALAGIQSELKKIVEGPIAESELDRARRYLVGSQAVSLQRYQTQASLLSLDGLYGLGPAHHLDYASRIEAVTLDDVKRVAGRLVQIRTPVVAIVR
jgi:zinc protease